MLTNMKKFTKFQIVWHTFDLHTLTAKFSFSFDNEIYFTETIDFSSQIADAIQPIESIDHKVIDNLLFHLSLALGISYYKLSPTTIIEIQSWKINNDQIFFWKQFYINGLWEFFFRNNIQPFAPEFISNSWTETDQLSMFNLQLSSNKALIPLGWGKDSLVSIELIKKLWIPYNTCTFGKDTPLYQEVNNVIHTPRLFIARQLDPLLFSMNKEGYYNWHVPISGIIAFTLTVAAYLYNYKYIVLSNEKSANEGNTEMNGMIINHQRSKSLEFEKTFDTYVHTYISSDLKYFSLLRGMYEIRIVEEFAKHKQYFSTFSSCNRNFHILPWGSSALLPNGPKRCGHCPKCAFVYTILRPQITHEQAINIFGKELYEDKSLEQLFKELLGISGIKPFECVGTNEEMILAMYKYYQQSDTTQKTYEIMKLFSEYILPHMSDSGFKELEEKLMKIYDEDNIPPEIKKILPESAY